jgi:hypothetical protein
MRTLKGIEEDIMSDGLWWVVDALPSRFIQLEGI